MSPAERSNIARGLRTPLGFAIAPLVPALLVALPALLHGDPSASSYQP